jgi:hypothetical protein
LGVQFPALSFLSALDQIEGTFREWVWKLPPYDFAARGNPRNVTGNLWAWAPHKLTISWLSWYDLVTITARLAQDNELGEWSIAFCPLGGATKSRNRWNAMMRAFWIDDRYRLEDLCPASDINLYCRKSCQNTVKPDSATETFCKFWYCPRISYCVRAFKCSGEELK